MIPTKEQLQKAFEQRHGRALQEKFSSATVAICGLGGLGSNIAVSLARSGIGKLILIDFDSVDITNLHRQQYKANQIGMKKPTALSENLREISPYITLDAHCEKITAQNAVSLLGDADIICEAFDRAEEKAMLVDTVMEQMPEKYIVAASGMAGIGSPNAIKTRRITSRFYLCGDRTSDVAEQNGLFAARVMLCAAHQAHTVLRILADQFEV
ncbi:MAG: sulfur carrier protein ThiS adenylyltransferase ThiF [Clostridia bacterium]|nr:sulfur carrier protein ThiS adenylyltransferase ThiF [Clostridia bacterium]